MDQLEKDIDSIIDTVSKNSVDEAQTFSKANVRFYDKHKQLTNEQLSSIKLNPDFVLVACNVVENLYDASYKTDKKILATNMLKYTLTQKGLNYSSDELKILEGIIESCHSRGAIKTISVKKKLGLKVANFFLSLLK